MVVLGNDSSMRRMCVPNVVLNASLNRYNDMFNVAHLNGSSIYNKLDQIRNIFSNTPIHAVCISETWFDASVADLEVAIQGFRLIRSDRDDPTKVKGGGVALYIRDDIKYTIKFKSAASNTDFLVVELKLGENILVIAAIYKPPDVYGSSIIENLLNKFHDLYTDILILGDLNIDALDSEDSVNKSFKTYLIAFVLSIVNSEPTHFVAQIPTLIDYIITNNLSKVQFCNQVSIPGISKHDLIYCSYRINYVNKPEQHYYRSFKDVNLSALYREIPTLNWNAIFSSPNVDEQINIFNTFVNYLFNKFVPLREVRAKNSVDQCWFDKDVLRCLTERDLAYQYWKITKRQSDYSHYKRLRNLAISIIRAKKRSYYSKIFSHDLPAKTLWHKLEQIGVKKPVGFNGDQFNPNELNSYFARFSSSNIITPTSQSQPRPRFPSKVSNFTVFSLIHVTSDEVFFAINQIKSNAVGLDNISLKFIKLIFPLIGCYLTHIFNHIITTSTFPIFWKNAKIIPLSKISCPTDVSHFRPISILSALSKVFEFILSKQITTYVNQHELLNPFQSGFRKAHGTTGALLRISHDLFFNMEQKKATAVVLLDFTKAFDSVPHSILIDKLSKLFNFSSSAVTLFSSYLAERTQTVFSNNQYSELATVSKGVPQGSILGPLLFSLYINDLPDVLTCSNYHLFADDFQIYLPFKPDDVLVGIAKINHELQSIKNWADANGLALNESKTQYIVVRHHSMNLSGLPEIVVNDTKVPCSEKVTNLGLILNCNLNWEDNTNKICSKVYFVLRRLWRFAHILPLHTRRQLFLSLLLPHFTYASPVFANLNYTCSHKLKMAFHACTRFVFLLRKFDHISAFVDRLLNVPISTHLDILSLVFLFKLIRSNTPHYLYSLLSFCSSTRTLNFIIPKHYYLATGNSYFVHVIKLWNSLPVEIKRSKTVGGFRGGCSKFLTKN